MKKIIKNFDEFITENYSDDLNNQIKNYFKNNIMKYLHQKIMNKLFNYDGDSLIKLTKEVKKRMPYKNENCKNRYEMKKTKLSVIGIKKILEYLQKENKGNYKRTLKDLKNKKSVIIGLRNKLEIKKRNQDKFIDALYFIPSKAEDEDMIIPYQITTTPSLYYYGSEPLNNQGTAIKVPGETLYTLKEADIGHGRYKMLIESEPVDIRRYPIGTTKFKTYKPSNILYDQHPGLHIHKSSDDMGICIGPWSAGCQVFASGIEYDEFINKLEKSTNNDNKFFYALIELDDIPQELLKKAVKPSSSYEGNEEEYNKYDIYADKIYDYMKGMGTDEESIYEIIKKLNNKKEWNKLNKSFGIRDGLKLKGWLKKELNEKEIEKINSIIKKFDDKI